MKISVAFLKANRKNARFIDKIIAFWCSSFRNKLNGNWRSGFSHCELILDGYMYSSSFRKPGGVRSKPHTEDTDSWDYITLDINKVCYENVKVFFKSQEGKKYDYFGLLGFIIPFKDHESKWFCSEICTTALQIAGVRSVWRLSSDRTSPNRLHDVLTSHL